MVFCIRLSSNIVVYHVFTYVAVKFRDHYFRFKRKLTFVRDGVVKCADVEDV